MAPEEKEDYDKIFDSLDPENGLLSEEKVRFVLMGLKIEVSMLDKKLCVDVDECKGSTHIRCPHELRNFGPHPSFLDKPVVE